MRDDPEVEIVVASGNSAAVPVVCDVIEVVGGGEMGGEEDGERIGVGGWELIVVGLDEVGLLIVPVMMKEAIPV